MQKNWRKLLSCKSSNKLFCTSYCPILNRASLLKASNSTPTALPSSPRLSPASYLAIGWAGRQSLRRASFGKTETDVVWDCLLTIKYILVQKSIRDIRHQIYRKSCPSSRTLFWVGHCSDTFWENKMDVTCYWNSHNSICGAINLFICSSLTSQVLSIRVISDSGYMKRHAYDLQGQWCACIHISMRRILQVAWFTVWLSCRYTPYLIPFKDRALVWHNWVKDDQAKGAAE